jgi:uncharacterized protein YegL
MDSIIKLEDLVNNPTPRVPVCLCLDTSGSMNRVVSGTVCQTGRTVYRDGQIWNGVSGGVSAIEELSKGVNQFFEAIRTDEVAMYSAEICVITFGGERAEIISPFATVDQQENSFELDADGQTWMGEAVNMALDCLEKRKNEYRSKGIDYFQPWLVIMTDGQPNGSQSELKKAISRVQTMVNNRKLTVFPLGVGPDVDMSVLAQFSPKRTPLKVSETKYKEFFEWLSQSVVTTSQSMPGETQTLDIAGIKGWSEL